MHWCADETLALLAVLPGVLYVMKKVAVWFRTWDARLRGGKNVQVRDACSGRP